MPASVPSGGAAQPAARPEREALARVVWKLEQMGAPCALIGGVALAFHGIDRATEDIDLLATEPSILNASLWEELRSEGISVEVTVGDHDDPLRGVVRIDSTE